MSITRDYININIAMLQSAAIFRICCTFARGNRLVFDGPDYAVTFIFELATRDVWKPAFFALDAYSPARGLICVKFRPCVRHFRLSNCVLVDIPRLCRRCALLERPIVQRLVWQWLTKFAHYSIREFVRVFPIAPFWMERVAIELLRKDQTN